MTLIRTRSASLETANFSLKWPISLTGSVFEFCILKSYYKLSFLSLKGYPPLIKYTLFTDREARIEKNFARGLELCAASVSAFKTEGKVFLDTDRPTKAGK